MAEDDVKSNAQWRKENFDPTIPFDGAAPENIPGPASNAELEVAAKKRAGAYGDVSTRYRPEFGEQTVKTGDAITPSDVEVNPTEGFEVGEDAGADVRAKAEKAADEGKNTAPQGRSSSPRGKQSA
jgi:hypothetical protein